MNFILGFFQEFWRHQVEFEVKRQSVRGSLLALKGLLGSTRRIVLFSLYLLVFLYAFFGLLTVAITSPDLSQETKPLVIYGLLAASFGGLLLYNLREETWIKRWGIRERIEALRLEGSRESGEWAGAEPTPQELATKEMRILLDKFEDHIETRLRNFERRQEQRLRMERRPAPRPNGSTDDMALY